MEVWAVANQKGGVVKTTTTISLGGLLADKGHRVLVIDIDPQGSMTTYFGYNPESIEASVTNLLRAENVTRSDVQAVVKKTNDPNLSLLPASVGLATIERSGSQAGMGLKMTKAISKVWNDFDYVLIDSPPVLGTLMINAIAACDHLLVPVQTEFLALKSLERMLRTVSMVTKSLNKELDYTVIPTLYDQRTKASVLTLQTLRSDYHLNAWPSFIPVDTRFRDASKQGVTPSQFDAESHGVVAYKGLLEELMSKSQQNDTHRSRLSM
ncbi:ParA family protein [Methylophaga thiooxydans]|uniref:CobQ/CobB/MinD/ParA nucleotide binding domain, putative n=1 Tax=Methylophaga thiooxydans DMS010 TaxID=637616 RepID=C0N7I4_9GAMM|nr:ParA family protein [Methylophaga thiooxydans]EEF79259.1 CobQ/CobB/MinD/ParA nucleotide binding domain, putative [Methylophaga thiooxydans DMS010]